MFGQQLHEERKDSASAASNYGRTSAALFRSSKTKRGVPHNAARLFLAIRQQKLQLVVACAQCMACVVNVKPDFFLSRKVESLVEFLDV